MAEISMGQLRQVMRIYILREHKTQAAFASSVGVSPAHVSGVLSGKKGFPIAWAVLIGAHIELKATVSDQLAAWVERYDELMEGQRHV